MLYNGDKKSLGRNEWGGAKGRAGKTSTEDLVALTQFRRRRVKDPTKSDRSHQNDRRKKW